MCFLPQKKISVFTWSIRPSATYVVSFPTSRSLAHFVTTTPESLLFFKCTECTLALWPLHWLFCSSHYICTNNSPLRVLIKGYLFRESFPVDVVFNLEHFLTPYPGWFFLVAFTATSCIDLFVNLLFSPWDCRCLYNEGFVLLVTCCFRSKFDSNAWYLINVYLIFTK